MGYVFLMILPLLFCVQVLASPARSAPLQATPLAAFNPYQYIPQGAKIPDPKKDIVFADLDGDGKDEAVLFYLVPAGRFVQPSIKVLKNRGKFWDDIWRTSANVGWDFVPPSGVYDLLGNGRPQIVSFISVGASCWGLLDIYRYDALMGNIRSINGWPHNGCANHLKITDLEGNGTPEIIFTETNYSTIPHIYWWNGENFVLSDSNFPDYYDTELRHLVAEALAPGSPARLMWGQLAFQIYIIQHRYSAAVDFCHRLLCLTQSATAVQRTRPSEGPARQRASLVSYGYSREARVHRWMGEAYEALHQLPRARAEYETARRLDTSAKRLDPYHMVPYPLN